IIESICRTLAENHEIKVAALVFIKPGTIYKTSSGKIQRHACRAAYLNGGLDIVAQWTNHLTDAGDAQSAPSDFLRNPCDVETWLVGYLSTLLAISSAHINADRPISHYGLDSLQAIELAHALEVRTGRQQSMANILQSASLADLAKQLMAETGEAALPEPSVPTPEMTAS